MKNKPKKFKVIAAYKSPYPEPIIFQAGEMVEVGREFTDDPDWEDWVWCSGAENKEAWVPKQYLEISGIKGVFKREYNALELSITEGEELYVHEVMNGFGMAEKSNGNKGWVPMKCLESA